MDVCHWRPEDEDCQIFETDCLNSFMFNDGGPVENGFRFCPYCGNKLIEDEWVDE